MAATKYQVFVSSTYEDLTAERDQVIRAVLEMGHIPVGMEMFSAADEQQWQIIARHIDESDYYAVIVAHRYGSVADGVSYTRKEYEYALSRGIPVLGFVIDASSSWPADQIETDEAAVSALRDFKSLVMEKPVSFWSSADDLYGKFSVALTKAITANPREGWVRSSSTVGPEVTAEISRLSAENARLRGQLDQLGRAAVADHEAELKRVDSQLRRTKNHFGYKLRGDPEWHQTTEPIPAIRVFSTLAPPLSTEVSIKAASAYLGALVIPKEEEQEVNFIATNQIQDLFADWMALDLVLPSTKRRSVKDTAEYWSLSEFGREVHRMQRRQRLLTQMEEEEAAATALTSVESSPSAQDDPEAEPVKRTSAKKLTAKKSATKKSSPESASK